MTDCFSLPSAFLRRSCVSPRFGRQPVDPLKQTAISTFQRAARPKIYPDAPRLPGKTVNRRPLTVGLGLVGIVLAPSWYFGPRSISTTLGKIAGSLFATAPLPDFPTRVPSLSPAEKLAESAKALLSITQKAMAGVGAFLGIGGVALLIKGGNAQGEEDEEVEYGESEISSKTNEEIKNMDLASSSNQVAVGTVVRQLDSADADAIPPPPPQRFPDGTSIRVVPGDISQFRGDAIVINMFENLIPDSNTVSRENFHPGGTAGVVYNKMPRWAQQVLPVPGGGTGAVYEKIQDIFLAKIRETGFKGRSGEWLLLERNRLNEAQRRQWDQQIRVPYIICVGMGQWQDNRRTIDDAEIRKAGETTLKAINDFNIENRNDHVNPIKSFGTIVHGAGLGGFSMEKSARLLKEGLVEEMAGRDKKGKGRAALDISIVENDENKLQDICKGFISFKAR